MRDRFDEFQDDGIELIAIAASAASEELESFPFPTLSDHDLSVIRRFGVFHDDEPDGRRIARPSVFVIDRAGLVRFGHVGEHAGDRPSVDLILLAAESLS